MKLKSYSSRTHQGPYLQINEDDVDVDLRNQLYLIFDGFGGSSIGDKAVQLLKETIKNFYTRIGGDPDSTLPFYYSHKYLLEGNALLNSMHYAHALLKKQSKGLEMSQRGGASAICVAQSENILSFASVGNCRAFLYRKGHLKQIVEADSLESLSPDEYLSHFYTSPVSGFGLFEDIHIGLKEMRVYEEDLIILMTDGVYARVDMDEIKYTIEKTDKSSSEKINELFKLSNSRGNLDNQSMLLLQY